MKKSEAKKLRQEFLRRKKLRYHTEGTFAPQTANDVHIILSLGAKNHPAFDVLIQPCIERTMQKFEAAEREGTKELFSAYCGATILTVAARIDGYVRIYALLADEIGNNKLCPPEMAAKLRQAISNPKNVWGYEV